jgi:hypothetical protein
MGDSPRWALVDKLIMLHETLRWIWSELRAGHFGSSGLHGYQFLANELLKGEYSWRRKRVVAEFVAFSARRNSDERALEIARHTLREYEERVLDG